MYVCMCVVCVCVLNALSLSFYIYIYIYIGIYIIESMPKDAQTIITMNYYYAVFSFRFL